MKEIERIEKKNQIRKYVMILIAAIVGFIFLIMGCGAFTPSSSGGTTDETVYEVTTETATFPEGYCNGVE